MSTLSSRPLALGAALTLAASCHKPPVPTPEAPPNPAGHTVFTDSVLHAERCAPNKAGEDWRRVCTPRDQSAVFRKAPPPR
jgi:hypothetical protein